MTRTTTPREVGLLRLVAQGLVGVAAGTGALDAVRRLTAVQAQALPGAVVSVALRTSSRSQAEVVAALDAATVVRTWPVRGTLHLVAADDLGWLLRTTAARTVARDAGRRAQLGLDEATVARAASVADDALAAAGPTGAAGLRRDELLRAWQDAGVATTGQRGYHLLAHLAQTGLLCLGPMSTPSGSGQRSEQLFVRVVDHVGPRPGPVGDEALVELARRYFLGHGPATVPDLARWAGITLGQARTGLAGAAGSLTTVEPAGVEHWLDPAVPDRLAACRAEAEQVLLLPGFDEYLLGYADRTAVLAPEHAERIVPGRNGVFRPTVLDAGRVVGTWRPAGRARREATAEVSFEPFLTPAPELEAAVIAAHARLP